MKTHGAYLYCFDLEGPLTPMDCASELATLCRCSNVFPRLSSYVADRIGETVAGFGKVVAGDTLSWIWPLLVDHNVVRPMMNYLAKKATKLDGAPELIAELKEDGEVYVISTSYDLFTKNMLLKLGLEISQLRATTIPDKAWQSQVKQEEINSVFTQFMETGEFKPSLALKRHMAMVQVMGGERKALAVRDLWKTTQIPPNRTFFVGDSITDKEALALVRDAGGLSVAFNANLHALEAAGSHACGKNVRDELFPIIQNWKNEKETESWTPETVLHKHKHWRSVIRRLAAELA